MKKKSNYMDGKIKSCLHIKKNQKINRIGSGHLIFEVRSTTIMNVLFIYFVKTVIAEKTTVSCLLRLLRTFF